MPPEYHKLFKKPQSNLLKFIYYSYSAACHTSLQAAKLHSVENWNVILHRKWIHLDPFHEQQPPRLMKINCEGRHPLKRFILQVYNGLILAKFPRFNPKRALLSAASLHKDGLFPFHACWPRENRLCDNTRGEGARERVHIRSPTWSFCWAAKQATCLLWLIVRQRWRDDERREASTDGTETETSWTFNLGASNTKVFKYKRQEWRHRGQGSPQPAYKRDGEALQSRRTQSWTLVM